MTTQTATSAATTLSIQGSRCSSLTSVSSAMSITSLSGLNLGDRVAVKSSRKLISLRRRKPKTGLVRFLGDTQFAVGQWVGIELDEPCGNSDGSVDGMRYFQCRPNHGFFAPVHKVSHSAAGGARSAARLAAQDKACPQDDGLPQNMENSGNVENVLQTQIRLLEAAADQKNVENGRLQGQLEEASRIAQEFREKHRVCSERCSSLMAEIDGFEEALRQANQALRQQEMDAESAKQNTRHLQVQVEELGRRAADSELAAQTLRQEKSAVQLELGQLSESSKEAAQSRLQLDNELSSARETIVDLRSAVAKLEQEKMELHARAEQLDLATGSFKAEGEAKDRLIADLIKDQETCDFELEEMKQQENVLLLSIQQLETDQIKCKEEAQSLREAAAALRAEKTQWLEDKSNLLRTIEDLNSQLIEAATLKEQCNQQSIEADRLRAALREERRRSDELRAAVDAGETQCRQMAQRSDQLLAQNQNFLEALNKMNQEKMQQIEGEKQVAVQLAVEIRDELKHFNDKILERDQSSEEERTDSKQRVAHMEQALSETEKHLLQLRQEVDNLKKKAYASPHPRNSGGVPALRNPRYNSHIWRDYLILSAIRHSRLYRRRW